MIRPKTLTIEEWLSGDRRFRVTCLNPIRYWDPTIPRKQFRDGKKHAYEFDTISTLICAHGHGMTIEEMNENVIWKGKPYIRIGYCKRCDTKDTVGLLNDYPEFVGLHIICPDANNPLFRCTKLPSPVPIQGRVPYAGDVTSYRGLIQHLLTWEQDQ